MRQSPVYCFVTADGRRSSPSFGSEGFTMDVRVGQGSANSHTLGVVEVRRLIDEAGRVHFRLELDGKVLKRAVYEPTTKEFGFKDVE